MNLPPEQAESADAPTVEEAITDRPRAMAAQELRLVSALVVLLGAGLFLALPFVLSVGSIVFLPFVTAVILSIVLSPLATRLRNWGLPNLLASFLALLVLVAIILLALLLILQPALNMVDKVPGMTAQIAREFSQLRGNFAWLEEINRQLGRMAGRSTAREVVIASPSVFEQLAFATPSVVIEVLLTLLMTFFMVESRVRLRRRLLAQSTLPGTSVKAARVVRDVQDRVASYILTVAVINFGMGAIVALGAWALDFEAPVMWGGLAALLNFLPYIGPMIMIVLLALVGLGGGDSLLAGIVAPAAYLGLHTLEADLVTPSILGARFTLNPVLILLSISYFSWIWGIMGALLSVPILLTLSALFDHIGKPNLIGFLFGEPLFPPRPVLAMENARDGPEQVQAAEVQAG